MEDNIKQKMYEQESIEQQEQERVPSASYITLKEYAEKNHITYEAVRVLKDKIWDKIYPDHVIDGKPLLIDEYAVELLNERRGNKKAVYMTSLTPAKKDDPMAASALSYMNKSFTEFNSRFDSLSEDLKSGFSGVSDIAADVSGLKESSEKLNSKLDELSGLSSVIDRKDQELSAKDKEIALKEKEIADLKAQLEIEKNKTWTQKLFRK